MPNPPGPDPDETPNPPVADRDAETAELAAEDTAGAEPQSPDDPDAATEVLTTEGKAEPEVPERRFTAPGFDASQTEIIQPLPEAATEIFDNPGSAGSGSKKATPQLIPPRLARRLPASALGASRSWGWVIAFILIILTLAVIAVLGTLWLTSGARPKVSQEDRVRNTLQNFDIAVQNGDLATLRSITCGTVRDDYVNYDEQAWGDTYRRVAAAKQYPVVASIDEVVVNGDHAEANVTAFMAYAPQIRSTRSFDLQYRDDQWKICQSHTD